MERKRVAAADGPPAQPATPGARRIAYHTVAFGVAFTTVFLLIVFLALPLWVLFRLPGAVVAPDSGS
ncbi:MAG: hypothetical protein GWM90_29325 [Gemmatimonadetes bacterium]|nr:hypothetical protein [Gemmatimonadota bacterium]NIQ59151.1 hypothetical protein [Gemmatimonadota bacterium]NIU79355.1 hypothetical protein [Gammaproteobacteria bacterium]NIX48023.1 hypothetical protein [Gemmatimonadota bacterium]NIY12394.1 hypothetical protein [Gemmatimonadota bacterium]